MTTDYLLKIFRVSIPHMPSTAAKFGQELQKALQPMIIKPSGNGGVQVCCALSSNFSALGIDGIGMIDSARSCGVYVCCRTAPYA